ncbi:MAG TPA: hypothetical protein VD993_15775 [Chitinophagaceae bacterium]|nr:hypothetical protein [Chitinophagaceae bacterium]
MRPMPKISNTMFVLKIVAGLLLFAISIIGIAFFRRYTGTIIPYPKVWLFVSIAIGIIGGYITYITLRRADDELEQSITLTLNNLKARAEKIKLEFDNCDFKDGSFTKEVEESYPGLIIASALVGSSAGAYLTPVSKKNIIQSFLIYTNDNNGSTEKFVSQAFPFDKTALKYYVMTDALTLYVHRTDRQQYFFELKGKA